MTAIEDPVAKAAQVMQAALDAQKQSYLDEGVVTLETRVDRIDRAISQLIKYQDKLVESMSSDFGHRSAHHSKMMDIAAGIGPMQHAKKHLKKWMKSQKRKTMFPINLLGGRSRIEYQPLGVIGIISPWNFPVNLTFGPLANAFGAGNRVMIKPSEFTPATSQVMREMIEEVFDPTEVAVFTGGPEVGQAFSGLAFDHLLFTGATSVAKHVMVAAAKNLVPVTLELGGKSPVLVGRSADIEQTCQRIMFGKTMNIGQICLAPDYTFVAEEKLDTFVEQCKSSTSNMFPTMLDNQDYTSVVNERHYQRLKSYLTDAQEKGATLVELNPANENFDNQPHHKMPPTLVLNTTDDMLIMQEEIFGPLMPVKTYKNFEEAVAYVNAHPRPLGLYYFGEDQQEANYTLTHTTSGGVTVNDVIMHVSQEDLPFGGVGPSGMGSYHGYDGFKQFSHAKSVFTQSNKDIAGMAGMRPPFGEKADRTIKTLIKP